MAKLIPVELQQALSNLHLEIERLNPAYTANLEMTSWVFTSSITDDFEMGVANLCRYLDPFIIEKILADLEIYKGRLEKLVAELKSQQGASHE